MSVIEHATTPFANEDARLLAKFLREPLIAPWSRQWAPPTRLAARTPHVIVVDEAVYAELPPSALVPQSAEERARIARSEPSLGQLFLERRAVVRLVLARCLGCMPGEVEIGTAPGGKPILTSGRIEFSLAHSAGLLAIAVARAPIGIDIEADRAVASPDAIARRWFLAEEQAALAALPPAQQSHGFMRLWTAKEAIAKRHGGGLRLMTSQPAALGIADEFAAGNVAGFSPVAGMIASLASESIIGHVMLFAPRLSDLLADR